MKRPDALTYALEWAGPKRIELQKALNYYSQPRDKLKRQAIAYLISALPYQTYTEITDTTALTRILSTAAAIHNLDKRVIYLRDSLSVLAIHSQAHAKFDLDIIDANFLINNVELAFEAWHKPWACALSFSDFCRYVLPYKSPGEKPQNLRRTFLQQYSSLCDTLHMRDSRRAVCATICQQLKQEYRCVNDFANNPVPILSTSAITKCKLGRCSEIAQLSGDVMRALGLPVTQDVCAWGDYNGSHAWNVLYDNHRFIPFLFSDGPLGSFKCEMIVADDVHYRRKRSKVWRYQFLPDSTSYDYQIANKGIDNAGAQLVKDVSASLLSCSNIVLHSNAKADTGAVYLCTFNNHTWVPVDRGVRNGSQVIFRQMGRGLCYLPVQVGAQQQLVPIASPFILTQYGRTIPLAGTGNKRTLVRLNAKFPIYGSNKIKIGDTYNLLFWHNGWQRLGSQMATSHELVFHNVPTDAILWLQDIDRGKGERIFTYENDKQVWW